MIDANGVKEELRIQRYLCKTTERTFSLLPEDLMPYRTPSLHLLTELWRTLLFLAKSHEETLANMIDDFPESESVSKMEYSHLQEWTHVLQMAMERVTMRTGLSFPSLRHFFEHGEAYTHNRRRGFLALAEWFYEKEHRFLFGTASQDR